MWHIVVHATTKNQEIVLQTTMKRKTLELCVWTIVVLSLFIFFSCYLILIPLAKKKACSLHCHGLLYQMDVRQYYMKYRRFPDTNKSVQSIEGNWSWRVRNYLSLSAGETSPYIMNEDWNSDSNLALIQSSSRSLRSTLTCPCSDSCDDKSTYVALVGEGTLWNEINNGHLESMEPHHKQMIIIIETTEPTRHWAEPGDDVTPEEVIRLFEADPGLVKNSKAWPWTKGHWPKHYVTADHVVHSFDGIKSVEELKKLLILPDDVLKKNDAP